MLLFEPARIPPPSSPTNPTPSPPTPPTPATHPTLPGLSPPATAALLPKSAPYLNSTTALATLHAALLSLLSPTKLSLYSLLPTPATSPLYFLLLSASSSNPDIQHRAKSNLVAYLDSAHTTNKPICTNPSALTTSLLTLTLGTPTAEGRLALPPRRAVTLLAFISDHIFRDFPTVGTEPGVATAITKICSMYCEAEEPAVAVEACKMLNLHTSRLVTSDSPSTPASLLPFVFLTTNALSKPRGAPDARDHLFQTVCSLSRANAFLPEITSTTVSTAALLFNCVNTDTAILRSRATAALDALLRAYTTNATAIPPEAIAKLMPLLWNAAMSKIASARNAAARWCSDCVNRVSAVDAVQLLVYLSGDPDPSTAFESKIGLQLNDDGIATRTILATSPPYPPLPLLPSFASLIAVLFSSAPAKRPTFHQSNATSKLHLLRAALAVFLASANSPSPADLAVYAQALAATLTAANPPPALSDEASTCMSRLMRTTPAFASIFLLSPNTPPPITYEQFTALALTIPSAVARLNMSICASIVLAAHPPSLLARVDQTLTACVPKLAFDHLFNAVHSHGAAHLASHTLSALLESACEPPAATLKLIHAIMESLSAGVKSSDNYVSLACSRSLALVFAHPAPPVYLTTLCGEFAGAFKALASVIIKYSKGDLVDVPRCAVYLESSGPILRASSAAGYDAASFAREREALLDSLYETLGGEAFKKDNEIVMSAGRALADYADCTHCAVTAPPPLHLDEAFSEATAKELDFCAETIYRLFTQQLASSNPSKRTAGISVLFMLVVRAHELKRESRESALVTSIVSVLDVVQQQFVKALSDPKGKQISRECACRGLAACHGLSKMCSGGLQEEMNEALLKAFGQTTNHGGSAMIETRQQEAARRAANAEGGGGAEGGEGGGGVAVAEGGAAGVSEAALGAYREMAAAAMEVVSSNKDDANGSNILHYLICLSTTHGVWTEGENKERFATRTLLIDDLDAADLQAYLRPHLQKLAPKLLRACHDPSAQTREQMNVLWEAITGGKAEGRAVVSQFLVSTIDILCKDSTNKLWRARCGGCGALSEVIVGRSWAELGGGGEIVDEDEPGEDRKAAEKLLTLWRVTMRALDDVRTNVRESGESLAKSLRSLTIRLCDPKTADVTAEEAEAATSTTLTWLIKHGLNQQCDESTGLCVSVLLGVIEVARAETLQPILPQLINNLICAMSGLEPSALSYLQLRMGGHSNESGEKLEDLRIRMAQSGPIGNALTKCVDVVKWSSLEVKREVVRWLDSALRNSVGAVSRVAVADVVGSLVASCPESFGEEKGTGAGGGNCVKLLRGFYYACERERGIAARDKLTFALGNLSSLAPEGSVRVLVNKLCLNYERATGSNGSVGGRRAAAGAVAAIASRSGVVFGDGGKADLFRRKVLPVSFVGREDEDELVGKAWGVVWEEGGGAYTSNNKWDEGKVGVRLEEKLLDVISGWCVRCLGDVSWAYRKSACVGIKRLCELGVVGRLNMLGGEGGGGEGGREREKRRAECR